MSISRIALTLFLTLLSLHLGLSMELTFVTWTGIGLSLIASLRLVDVERPTAGLLFVLFGTGGLMGNQVLEDWALEGSWAQENGLAAGLLLSMLLYLLWIFAAGDREEKHSAEAPLNSPVDRDSQTILAWGLLILMMMAAPESTIVNLFDTQAPLLALIAIPLACLALMADRSAGFLLGRVLLLIPVLVSVPLTLTILGMGQAPVIAALGNLVPSPSNFTPTGFSPYQTLRASVFLRPSNRAVMRIESATRPNAYLAGNRLTSLNEELIWLPSEQALRSYSTVDAEPLPGGEWRYSIDNHHVFQNQPPQSLTVHSLSSDDYVFITPGTSHISGRFNAISRNAADVMTPNYDRGANKRWRLESESNSLPEANNPENLLLPSFWDENLQTKSQEFAGRTTQETADNIVSHFVGRQYSLSTNFDPAQPFHDFFLNEEPAYCFWFATGATLALRANGIPSRLVGGYLIHEQLNDSLWLVRERDAHSWVEWQDEQGYWHTIDPTPPSIESFFGGYQSSQLSVWYHTLAGQYQMLIDRILADELTANVVRYGGIAILIFLFAREYRRIRGRGKKLNSRAQQWEKLWLRFLTLTRLPSNAAWTASNYAENLPTEWPESYKEAVLLFLQNYNSRRFGVSDESDESDEQSVGELEKLLENCAQTASS